MLQTPISVVAAGPMHFPRCESYGRPTVGDHPRWVAVAEGPWPRRYNVSIFEADLEVRSYAVVTGVVVTRQDATGHRVACINQPLNRDRLI